MASATSHRETAPNNKPIGLFVILNLLTTREIGSPEDIKRIDSVFRKLGFLNLHTNKTEASSGFNRHQLHS